MFNQTNSNTEAGGARSRNWQSESTLASSKGTYSFLDAAEKVLDQFGNRNSMHYRDITDRAMSQGWLNTSGKTPEATMNAQLVTELTGDEVAA